MSYKKSFKVFEAEERSTELTKSDAAAMNKFIKSLKIKAKPIKETTINDTRFVKLETVKIDPSSVGGLSPVFTTIDVDVKFGKSLDHEAIFISLQYSWTHPSGSNGYTLTYISQDGGKTFKIR